MLFCISQKVLYLSTISNRYSTVYLFPQRKPLGRVRNSPIVLPVGCLISQILL